jgi:Peptidase family M28
MRLSVSRQSIRVALLALAISTGGLWPWILAQGLEPSKGLRFPAISPTDLKTWLTYISSNELQGRQVFTEGYGIAAQYVADELKRFSVKPLGDDGTYFQIVKLRSYKVTRGSSITVEVNGQSRTFKDGDHVTFPARAGGRQSLTLSNVEFAGPGRESEFNGPDVAGKLMLFMGGSGSVRAFAIEKAGARATIAYVAFAAPPTPAEEALTRAQDALNQAAAAVAAAQQQVQAERGSGRAGPVGGGRGRGRMAADIPPTPTRVDAIVPPQVTADDAFFEFLLSGTPGGFADLKARSGRGEALTPFSVPGVRVTIEVDNTYVAVSTQLTRNVVGMVEGADPKLKSTYVLFGAHLDHVGYATTDQDIRGRVNTPISVDPIWNGADDDGSGTTAELGIAKAFANGPRPKRSVVFVWHAGEEADLYGSRYNADFPVVPLDRIQCQLNIDMIGRNRDNDPSQSNTVFVIGADRISTDLHNLIVDTNATLAAPLKLDYEYNDPADPNTFYTRSDHYSYASKGVPIAFFFTGTHPDYHANSDSVEKILFDKQARIAQLVYQTGFAVANSDGTLERDNKGPRAGRGFTGKIQR